MRQPVFLGSALLFVAVATLVARGPRSLTVTFHSDPEGAMLYANSDNHLFGYTPIALKYQPNQPFKDGRQCQTFERVKVRWASGAEAEVETFGACPQNGSQQQLVFVRPDVPGRELDVQFTLQVQQLALLREQARAAEADRLQREWAALFPAPTPKKTTTCTSSVIGTFVYTTCR